MALLLSRNKRVFDLMDIWIMIERKELISN